MTSEFESGSLPKSIRCFVLWGEDTVSRERSREAIVAEISGREGPCIRERSNSTLEPVGSFIARMAAPTLFQETRIFQLPHAQSLGNEELDDLDAAIEADIPGMFAGSLKSMATGRRRIRSSRKIHSGKRLEIFSPCLHGRRIQQAARL